VHRVKLYGGLDEPHAGGCRIAGMDTAGLDIPVKDGVAVVGWGRSEES